MKYLILITSLFTCALQAQVGIEVTEVRGDALIDFPQGQNRGIILPKAVSPTGTEGTLLFNMENKKVTYYNGQQWIDMNTNPGPSEITVNNTNLSEVQEPTIIGATSSTADGVLIMESENKALVLPWVENPHETMINPEPGTICFDTVTQSIAVFNGTEWSYWK